MNIPLKQHYLDWIAEQVSAGRYASEIEAVEDALADKIAGEERQYFREKLRRSEEDIAAGRTVLADDAFFERSCSGSATFIQTPIDERLSGRIFR